MTDKYSSGHYPEDACKLNALAVLIARLRENQETKLTKEEIDLLSGVEQSYSRHVAASEDRIPDEQI